MTKSRSWTALMWQKEIKIDRARQKRNQSSIIYKDFISWFKKEKIRQGSISRCERWTHIA